MEAIALYSASAEDLDTVVCFLLLHDISAFSKNTQYPVTDHRVVISPSQSVSQNSASYNFPLDGKYNPRPGAPFKYRSNW